MELISLFAISYLILIPVLIYWIGDKKKGLFPLASFYMCIGINVVVKLTACIYRPWIRDARVIPAGDAISTATGYSFPSGHVATSGPIYAGLAKVYHDSKKWISWICVILLLITAFSRNYLGVHTPQDVIIALLETVLSVYVMGKIFRYLEEKPKKENILLLLQFLFAVAALVYVTFKPYPMEYKDGVLIVDPQKMMNDGYGDLAMTMIFPIARFIEKKWIRFRPVGCNKKGLIAGIIGSVFFALINQLLKPCLVSLFGSHWGKFLGSGILVFFCIAAYPLIIKLLFNKEDKTEE
ncbi:MAG: phosphatase PAP2 family protein [Solobacterium sp.]|nr:phosphatase PAP2 family protein [Solobacterium sp.]